METARRLCLAALLQLAVFDAASAGPKSLRECGLASVYSSNSETTASGVDIQTDDLTAAHRSLKFGTMVHIANRENGRSAVVLITDRGPFVAGRIVDISQIAVRGQGISRLSRVCLSLLPTPAR